MKLGFQLKHTIDPKTIESLGKALIEPGYYSAVELEYPVNTIGNDESLFPAYQKSAKALIARYNLRVSLHIPTNLDCGAQNAAVRRVVIEEMKKSIDFSAEMGAQVLSVHGATIGTFDYPAVADTPAKAFLREVFVRKKSKAMQATVDMLSSIGEYAKQYHCSVALENVLLQQEVIHTPDDLNAVLQDVNLSNVGALFDCGHANRIGYDCAQFIRKLGKRLIHVHLNDNDGTCDLHGHIGSGTVEFPPIFRELHRLGYEDTVLVEIIPKSVDDMIQNAQLLTRYMQSGIIDES